jgi:cellulose synthase/poly-beta-1,6-N-acetylglucosamine synthase-like glycosyltransferase
MNKKLSEGYKVVQGYLDSKNPKDTWITACYSITFWQTNRMFQLARNNMGLSSQLGGTGLCIDIEVLKKLGWGVSCLTEDLEFTCKLVYNGYKVGFAHDAVVYDEKPLTLVQSWRQRRRWMQGYADVSGRYFFKLLKKGIVERSLTAVDCAIYTVQPVLFIIMGIVFIIGLAQGVINSYGYLSGSTGVMGSGQMSPFTIMTIIFTVFLYVYTPFLLNLDKKLDLKILWYYFILMPIYQITWFPIAIQGILKKNDKEWSHTKHTRSVDIDELEKAN